MLLHGGPAFANLSVVAERSTCRNCPATTLGTIHIIVNQLGFTTPPEGRSDLQPDIAKVIQAIFREQR